MRARAKNRWAWGRCFLPLLLAVWVRQACGALVPSEGLGLRVAAGFKISLFADSDLANDIYAMTLDSRGRVVVTGQGYIKVLEDTDGDGKADKATFFAETKTGGMGLCFDGNDLLFVGDRGLHQFRDADGDGRADAPPEKLLDVAFGEHGGHAIRKGPDGWWYLLGGNDSGISAKNASLSNSPVRSPEAGALLRLAPDFGGSEIVCDGLRNAYDFDFNAAGEMFAYDSDAEGDFFLPWYTATRLYHLARAGHHGWRLNGWTRSWNRPDYYADTVDILSTVGRGSPTGVVAYRHTQFPEKYRNGLFALDWTFGKVYFFDLKREGASYRARSEVFLEPIGTQGFAPTDVVVAPDGSLYLSIGGRKTRGAVYRIQYQGQKAKPSADRPELETVLAAPQPLDAWSRALWVPLAKRIGPDPFRKAITDEARNPEERCRAIEVHTELFGAIPPAVANAAGQSKSAPVRARVAWSVGVAPGDSKGGLLLRLAADPESALVRRVALEAVLGQIDTLSGPGLPTVLQGGFDHFDKRVRQIAARVAARVPAPAWESLWLGGNKLGPRGQATLLLAALWREQPKTEEIVTRALSVLRGTRDRDLQLEAVRVVMMAFGDWRLREPSAEACSGYELAGQLGASAPLAPGVLEEIRRVFPSGNSFLDLELSRMMAMLEDPDDTSVQRVAKFFTDEFSPTAEFHYLAVLSKLKGQWPAALPEQIAATLLNLDQKLEGLEQRPKQNWPARLNEIAARLVEKEKRVGEALVRDPGFPTPAHVVLAEALGPELKLEAAKVYLGAATAATGFSWSPGLVSLLSMLPAAEVRPLFRQHWDDPALRDALTVALAANPEEADRFRFLTALNSPDPRVAESSLDALAGLPPLQNAQTAVTLAKLLRRSLSDPGQKSARRKIMRLLNAQAGGRFQIEEDSRPGADHAQVYQPVFAWLQAAFPREARAVSGQDEAELVKWSALLKRVAWESGNPRRGEDLFAARSCRNCHDGSNPIGPDLRGAAGRMSAADLFAAILYPSRDIAPPYRTTRYTLKNGESHTGIAAFVSAEGVLLQTASGTIRLSRSNIVAEEPSEVSLMPQGLLEGLGAGDLADLHAYLKNLGNSR